MGYTKRVDQYIYTETVIFYDGTEVGREQNNDEHLYDTGTMIEITDEEAEDYL